MNTTNDNARNEVMNTVKKHEALQTICNAMYTDMVRTNFKGLNKDQINAIYIEYTNQLNN